MTGPRKALTDYERSLKMSRTQSQKQSGGITFAGALGLLFIGLKLGHAINWSWWLVLLPLYGGLALVLLVVVVCGLIIGIAEARKGHRRRPGPTPARQSQSTAIKGAKNDRRQLRDLVHRA